MIKSTGENLVFFIAFLAKICYTEKVSLSITLLKGIC